MANAGRVLILAKGAWSATTNYVQLDMVSHNSVAYLARQASVGVDPSTDVAMNYWMPFGSAAQIATTSTPGLVMPDGTTITITNTGLIKAALGIGDITGVTIASPTNGQVLKYNSTTQKWENGSLGTAAGKNFTTSISSGSGDLITSGAVYSANQTLTTKINKAYKSNDSAETTIDGADYIPFYDSSASAMKKILVSNAKFGGGALYYSGKACSATTGNFCTVSSADITANHVVAECTFSKPSAITTDVTWTTSSGSLVLNGTCGDATCTANIVLVKKSN